MMVIDGYVCWQKYHVSNKSSLTKIIFSSWTAASHPSIPIDKSKKFGQAGQPMLEIPKLSMSYSLGVWGDGNCCYNITNFYFKLSIMSTRGQRYEGSWLNRQHTPTTEGPKTYRSAESVGQPKWSRSPTTSSFWIIHFSNAASFNLSLSRPTKPTPPPPVPTQPAKVGGSKSGQRKVRLK